MQSDALAGNFSQHARCPVGGSNSPRWYSGTQIRALRDHLDILVPVLEWAENYLARPHKDLGRSGDVCPFVGEALMRESLQFSVIKLHTKGEARFAEIESIVLANRALFIEKEQGNPAADPLFNSLIMIFPDVSDEEAPIVIDGVQRKLKPQFVKDGLMLGEFHVHNESPGLRNPDFRPLRCPIPLLAIRHMVESDLPFMNKMYDSPELRLEFLNSYLNFLGSSLNNGSRIRAEAALAAVKEELSALTGK